VIHVLVVLALLTALFTIGLLGFRTWFKWWYGSTLSQPLGRYSGTWSLRKFVIAPEGRRPIPFDNELLASRNQHNPLHGAIRKDGRTWCEGCGAWRSPLEFERTGQSRVYVLHSLCGSLHLIPSERPPLKRPICICGHDATFHDVSEGCIYCACQTYREKAHVSQGEASE